MTILHEGKIGQKNESRTSCTRQLSTFIASSITINNTYKASLRKTHTTCNISSKLLAHFFLFFSNKISLPRQTFNFPIQNYRIFQLLGGHERSDSCSGCERPLHSLLEKQNWRICLISDHESGRRRLTNLSIVCPWKRILNNIWLWNKTTFFKVM